MKIKTRALMGRVVVLMLAGVVLAGCASKVGMSEPPLANSNLIGLLDGKKTNRLGDPFIRIGLERLKTGDYIAASKAFNRALKFDPTDPNLHFLNALTYHLRAQGGDSSQIEMAKVGYNLALQYDSSNYWAAYQLGQISFREQRFRAAQDAFAYALLFDSENPDFLHALAVASYYAQDLDTALKAIDKAAEKLPNDADVTYDRAMISAAAGNIKGANLKLATYGKIAGAANPFRTTNLRSRIQDWRKFYKNKSYLQKVQSTADILGSDLTTEGIKPDIDDTSSSTSKKKKKASTRMTLVDVIIIRSEERLRTNKGVNLLNGLAATLSGTIIYNRVSYLRGGTPSTENFTWSPTLTFSSSAYSLNIFNDNNDQNEVLARPTLVALDGKKSEFFSGAVWHVELTGAAGSEGAVQDIPVGIKLDVTPKFLSEDKIELNVSAARAFIEDRASTANFSNFAQTTKTLVTANVVMKFGDTLILSGLSEKETEIIRDGVPILQDIPIIQYVFSNESTLNFTKSVLILITPRKPTYTHEDGTAKIDLAFPPDANMAQKNLDELKGKSTWAKPASNVDAALWHLKKGKFFKEFRSGDVTMEIWSYPGRLERMIGRSIQFLYY